MVDGSRPGERLEYVTVYVLKCIKLLKPYKNPLIYCGARDLASLMGVRREEVFGVSTRCLIVLLSLQSTNVSI